MVDLRADTASSSDKAEVTETEDQSRTHQNNHSGGANRHMLPDKMEHCIVFMNSWDVSGVFWSFSMCIISTIPHLPPPDPSNHATEHPV